MMSRVREHSYLGKACAFVVATALIAGMVSCGDGGNGDGESYALTITSTSGGSVIEPGEGEFTYNASTVVSLVAEADEGYYFVNWAGDVEAVESANSRITAVTMDDDYSITADFELIPPAHFVLTIYSTTGGSVTEPGEGSFVYDIGAVVNLTGCPDSGYQFVNWTGDVGSIANVDASETMISMNGDYEITANFGAEIRNWYDLDAIRSDLSGSYVLMNDLDSSTYGYEELAGPTANEGKGWEPIGIYDYPEIDLPFKGIVDGRGYEIEDLSIDRPEEGGIGLFGWVSYGGIVKNLGMINVTVNGGDWVGGLAGWNLYAAVSSCYVTGSVTGQYCVGGLLGVNGDGAVASCYAACNVTGSFCGIGGLIGCNSGTVSNSYYNYDEVLINERNMITTGALCNEDFEEWLASGRFLDINERLAKEGSYYVIDGVGDFKQLLAFGQDASLKLRLGSDLDLAGEPDFYIPYFAGEFNGNNHRISNWTFECDFAQDVGLFGFIDRGGKVGELGVENVSITARGYIGGLVGVNYGSVTNCHSTGSLVAESYPVGGLVGWNAGPISDCYSTSSVTGSCDVGGLVGYSGGGAAVSDCYATGSVTGSGMVGGLAGRISYCAVSNCYSSGSVTGSSDVGGLVGRNEEGAVTNCFWDIETSGRGTSAGGTGKSTAEMKDISTFSGALWDIVTVANPDIRNLSYIWNIVDDETYPFLSWEPV